MITNKRSRIDELDAAVKSFTAAGAISAQDARRLKGRFTCARAQVFGRCGAPAMRLLGVVVESRRPQPLEVAAALEALRLPLAIIVESPPRLVRAHP